MGATYTFYVLTSSHYHHQIARAVFQALASIITVYFLTNMTPIVNTNMQIINVIKDDWSLNQSISPFLNNVKPIPIKLTAIRTYPVVFALILNPLLRPSFQVRYEIVSDQKRYEAHLSYVPPKKLTPRHKKSQAQGRISESTQKDISSTNFFVWAADDGPEGTIVSGTKGDCWSSKPFRDALR